MLSHDLASATLNDQGKKEEDDLLGSTGRREKNGYSGRLKKIQFKVALRTSERLGRIL